MTKPQSRITSLSVGRVYNLGNYENLRFEITVDIPQGRSPSLVLKNLAFVMRAANPKGPHSRFDYDHAVTKLKDPAAWHKNVKPDKERRKRIRDMVKDCKKIVREYEAWLKRRAIAQSMLDRIGAVRQFKDHKNDWQDDLDFEF